MSRIVKGLPFSIYISMANDDVPVNLNDSTWQTTAELHYQTQQGAEPFSLTLTPAGNGHVIDISSDQTSTLDHKSTGYVFVIRASKLDQTVNLKSVVPVSVVDDI